MEIIRRHPKSKRPGSLFMEPGERIFNPSRQTDRLLAQAERIGPHTFSLCEQWFREEGRTGQRRMYGLVNLVRHYPARHVEKAAELAGRNGLRSSKAVRRMVQSMAAEAEERSPEPSAGLTQEHPLIRSGEDYGAFWEQHAAQGAPPAEPAPKNVKAGAQSISREQLEQVWQQASWLRVIEHFDLSVEDKRRRRDDEIWLKSPFTGEEQASMHVSLSENIFKDFSSGQGGGIMQFCREMLRRQGREMTMFQVAQWMVEEGISTLSSEAPQPRPAKPNRGAKKRPPAAKAGALISKGTNPPIEVDLRPYLRADHPELHRRGISDATCRYLGCGFLPQRAQAKTSSPLNSRLVFQIRALRENRHGLEAVILSHTGRALSRQQEQTNGKYWSYPFRKGWEIYNQDQLLLDVKARQQTNRFGLILVEGFFDVAKLVEADCRNVGALMGTAISAQQIERLAWIRTRVGFPHILLFLDRDRAGREAMQQIRERLHHHNLEVIVFDWDQKLSCNGQAPELIPESIQDPADMPVEQLRRLRKQGII
jgi:5S rRNA maturation endonuclease (ribonuclease M5)